MYIQVLAVLLQQIKDMATEGINVGGKIRWDN